MPPALTPPFAADLMADAAGILDTLARRGLKLATAESCTGGLIAGLFTEIPGSSRVLERGFVTYSNEAKTECLGVPADLIASKGAVSREVAEAMARGAIAHARAKLAIAVTGVAGPDGGSAQKPVGLVHLAVATPGGVIHRELRFGSLGRTEIRLKTVRAAVDELKRWLDERS